MVILLSINLRLKTCRYFQIYKVNNCCSAIQNQHYIKRIYAKTSLFMMCVNLRQIKP